MIASGFSAFASLAIFLVLILVSLLLALANFRLGLIAFCGLIGFVVLEHFGPMVLYDASRIWRGGYHEREIEGVVYRVTLSDENELSFQGSRHASQMRELRFVSMVPEVGNVAFRISGIDQEIDSQKDCPVVKMRFGLKEIERSCGLTVHPFLPNKSIYQALVSDQRRVTLGCSDGVGHVKYDPPNCSARFQIGRFTVGISLSLVDPGNWPQVYAHLEHVLKTDFAILP